MTLKLYDINRVTSSNVTRKRQENKENQTINYTTIKLLTISFIAG